MDPEKYGINVGLKNMAAFTELNKENAKCDCSLKFCVLTSISKLKFSG